MYPLYSFLAKLWFYDARKENVLLFKVQNIVIDGFSCILALEAPSALFLAASLLFPSPRSQKFIVGLE